MLPETGDRPTVVDDEIDLIALWEQIWHGRLLILGVTACAILLAFLYISVVKPVYQAEALLRIDTDWSVPGFPDLLGSVSTAAEIELMESHNFLGGVLDVVSLEISEGNGPEAVQFVAAKLDREEAVRALADSISISEKGRDSNHVRVIHTGTSPQEIRLNIETLISQYIQQGINQAAGYIQRNLVTLERQKEALSGDLADVVADIEELISQDPGVAERTGHTVYDALQEERARLQASMRSLDRNMHALRGFTDEPFPKAVLVDGPRVAPNAVSPRKAFVLVLSTLMGLMLGLGGLLLRSIFDRRALSFRSLESAGVPVLAEVAYDGNRSGYLKLVFGRAPDAELTRSSFDPSAPSVESIRSLRTSLMINAGKTRNPVVLLTGSAGAGRTFIAANLAAATTGTNQRVLVVDADLRSGHLHNYLAGDSAPGLADYLAGTAELEQILRSDPGSNTAFVCVGQKTDRPAEMLMRPQLKQFFAEVAQRYDLVLVIAPSVTEVTDSVLLAQYVGTSVLVARSRVSRVDELMRAARVFERNGFSLNGVVLNGCR